MERVGREGGREEELLADYLHFTIVSSIHWQGLSFIFHMPQKCPPQRLEFCLYAASFLPISPKFFIIMRFPVTHLFLAIVYIWHLKYTYFIHLT